jgi:hypothetical protein
MKADTSSSYSLTEMPTVRMPSFTFTFEHHAIHYAVSRYRSSLYLMKQVQSWILKLHLSTEKGFAAWRKGAASQRPALLPCHMGRSLAMRTVSQSGSKLDMRAPCSIYRALMTAENWCVRVWLRRFHGRVPALCASRATTRHN